MRPRLIIASTAIAVAAIAVADSPMDNADQEVVIFADQRKPRPLPADCAYDQLPVLADKAHAIWKGTGISTYSFTAERLSFASLIDWPSTVPLKVVVQNGSAVETSRALSMDFVQSLTVEGRFTYIAQVIATSPDCVRVTFDDTFGFPQSIYVDPELDETDDDIEYRFSDFGA